MHDTDPITTLRIEPRTRRAMSGSVAVVAGTMVLLSALSLAGVTPRRGSHWLVTALGLFGAGWGAAMLVGLRRSRVVLGPGEIEVIRFLDRPRRVARADIVARRFHPGGWRRSPYHVLVLRNGAQIRLPPYLEHPARLHAVLADIPLLPWHPAR